jgi:hypothetical protein
MTLMVGTEMVPETLENFNYYTNVGMDIICTGVSVQQITYAGGGSFQTTVLHVLKTALQIHNILRGRGTFTFLLTVKFT